MRLTVEDPFGLARAEIVQGEAQALVVYPRLVTLERPFFAGGARAQEGRRLLLRRPSGFDLHSVREHAPGESLRNVHWRSTAHRGQLMVKELEDAPRDETVVLLDGEAAAVVGDSPTRPSTWRCARPARSSTRRCAAGGAACSSSTRRRARCSRSRRRPADWQRALEVLAAAEPTATTPAFALLESGVNPAARSLELVVVTSRIDARLVDRLVQRALSRHGVSLVYVEPDELRRPGGAAGAAAAAAPGDRRSGRRRAPRRRPGGGALALRRRRLRRTVLVAVVPAGVIAAMWLRLEHAARPRGIGCGGRRARARARARAAARGACGSRSSWRSRWPCGSPSGFRRSIPERLVTGFGSRFSNGFLDFYDVKVPFDPRVHADMRGVILAAVFGFVLVLGLAVAARRPVAATLVLLLGAGWPATLAGDAGCPGEGRGHPPRRADRARRADGETRAPRRPSRPRPRSCWPRSRRRRSSAVAKGELVAWQQWDFADTPQAPVSVSYVWDAQYGGLVFPRRRTTVLEIKAPRTSLYWRAAVLDIFAGDRWLQGPPLRADALEPAAARDRTNWVRQQVTVEALADTHLVGGSIPVAFAAGDAPLQRPGAGVALPPVRADARLPVHGVELRTAAEAGAARAVAAACTRRRSCEPDAFLDVWPGVTMPPFGTPHRAQAVSAVLDAHPEIVRYAPLDRIAAAVAGDARSPYAAALALEAWFRVGGGFTYTAHPAVFPDAPLVGFVAQTRAGYCQYFAGAMALMLRYLGVPARVAVGFSSGTYDAKTGVWTVTDHDAHAWVEAWFRGFGWLPFDPTPAAGRPEQGS